MNSNKDIESIMPMEMFVILSNSQVYATTARDGPKGMDQMRDTGGVRFWNRLQ